MSHLTIVWQMQATGLQRHHREKRYYPAGTVQSVAPFARRRELPEQKQQDSKQLPTVSAASQQIAVARQHRRGSAHAKQRE